MNEVPVIIKQRVAIPCYALMEELLSMLLAGKVLEINFAKSNELIVDVRKDTYKLYI